jgi:hypothetical protein
MIAALLLIGCSKSPKPATETATETGTETGTETETETGPPTPAPRTDAAPATNPPPATVTTCEDACTEWAVCWETLYGGDFRGGGNCVSACDELADADRGAHFVCVAGATDDCKAMERCFGD